MKAILVEKNHLDFTRGTNPKTSLNIGEVNEIKEKLNQLYSERQNQFRDYVYVSPDFIIVRYAKRIIDRMKEVVDEEPIIWIIKWVELPLYEVQNYDYKESLMIGHPKKQYNEVAIYKNRFILTDDPENMGSDKEIWISKDRKKSDPTEEFQIMTDALNEKLGSVKGFEPVDRMYVDPKEYEDKIQELINSQ